MAHNDNFSLFGTHTPADTAIQFLIDEQKKGNKRAKDIGSVLGNQMEKVFPNFKETLEGIIGGSEERREQLNTLFGLKLGEPITGEDVTELALGFGVGSIKGITGVPGIGLSFGARPLKGMEPALSGRRPIANINESTTMVEVQGTVAGKGTFIEQNIGGQKPSTFMLEAQAVGVAAKKSIQAKVKQVQKDLQVRSLEEVIPGKPPNRVRELAQKGLRHRVKFNDETQTMEVFFESERNSVHPEFTLIDTETGTVVKIDYNSKLVNFAESETEFDIVAEHRKLFGNSFNEFLETPNTQRQMQRMLTGQSAENMELDHTAEITVMDSGAGIEAISKMMEFTAPETIKEAAIKVGGKVFTGQIHAEAMDKAFADPNMHEKLLGEEDMEDGFVTSTGRFVSREEAAKIEGLDKIDLDSFDLGPFEE